MKPRIFAKKLNQRNQSNRSIIVCLVIIGILSLLNMGSYVSGATTSGNTTVYEYSTNETLVSGPLVIFQCNASGKDATLTLDIDPYVGTDEKELIKAYYRDALNGSTIAENVTDYGFANRTRVVLDLNATHSYNLTYVEASGSWEGLISSNESEDIILTFKANSKSYECLNATYTIKFRDAFYYTLRFYKGTNMTTDVSVSPYKNEFQYVYLRFYNTTTSLADSTGLSDMSYLDRMFSWMPYYEQSFSVAFDDEVTFWDRYENGEARIKLYEAPRNYSIHLMTDDTYGMTWDDEFTRPQIQDYSWKSKVIPRLKISEAEDKTLSIYLSRWEVQKFLFLMNIGYWVLVFVIWGILMIFISQHSWKAAIGFTIGYFTFMKMIGLAIF